MSGLFFFQSAYASHYLWLGVFTIHSGIDAALLGACQHLLTAYAVKMTIF
jgi:exoribonuclease II